MSDMVPEVLNAALDSLFTPKEPGELEYQGDDGLLYCRNCHTPVQCRVKLWGRDKIVPCLCRCQQEAMAEKKRQDELLERQRKIRQLKATGIQEKHLLEWNFAVAEDNKDIQMAKRYVEQWKKVKAENITDAVAGTTAGEHTGHVPTHSPEPFSGEISGACSGTVRINGLSAATVGSITTERDGCCGSSQGAVGAGSGTVRINGKPAARMGDTLAAHSGSGTVTGGSPDVKIGG